MTKVLIHFGFHKTGTSTTEHCLLKNAQTLKPHLHVAGYQQLGPVIQHAKAYSAKRTDLALDQFGSAWQSFLARYDIGDPRAICISCVDLTGHMPGHASVHDYSAAAPLLKTMAKGLETYFGAGLSAMFVASTRKSNDWLKSLWAQNLKVHRTKHDLTTFAETLGDISDHGALCNQLATHLAPHKFAQLPLENALAHPLGTAGQILQLLGISQTIIETLTPQKPLKVSPSPEGLELLLEANRSALSDDELAATKQDILRIIKTMKP